MPDLKHTDRHTQTGRADLLCLEGVPVPCELEGAVDNTDIVLH